MRRLLISIFLAFVFIDDIPITNAHPIDINECLIKLDSLERAPPKVCRDFSADKANPSILRAEILANVADKEWSMKNYAAALSDLNTALRIDPKNVSSLKMRGFIEIQKEDFRSAEEDLTKTLSLEDWSGSRAAILTNLSLISLFQGRPDAAIARVNAAIKLDPKLSRAYRNRGAAYIQKNRIDKAIDDEKLALSLPDPPSDAFFYLGQALKKAKNDEGAIKAFSDAIKLNGLRKFAYLERAKLLEAKGKNAAALRDLKEAWQFDRNDKEIAKEIIRLSGARP